MIRMVRVTRPGTSMLGDIMKITVLLILITTLFSQEIYLNIEGIKIPITQDDNMYIVPQADVGNIPVTGKQCHLTGRDGKTIPVTLVTPLSSYSFNGSCLVEDMTYNDKQLNNKDSNGVIISKTPLRRFKLQLGYPVKTE